MREQETERRRVEAEGRGVETGTARQTGAQANSTTLRNNQTNIQPHIHNITCMCTCTYTHTFTQTRQTGINKVVGWAPLANDIQNQKVSLSATRHWD